MRATLGNVFMFDKVVFLCVFAPFILSLTLIFFCCETLVHFFLDASFQAFFSRRLDEDAPGERPNAFSQVRFV